MTVEENKGPADTDKQSSEPQDVATVYRELTKGEHTATKMEASLSSLESKLDAMLAAFEQHEPEHEHEKQQEEQQEK